MQVAQLAPEYPVSQTEQSPVNPIAQVVQPGVANPVEQVRQVDGPLQVRQFELMVEQAVQVGEVE